MDPMIRKAAPDDWPGVAAVLAELGRPDARGNPEEDALRAVYTSYIGRDDVDAFVAHGNDEILGFANIEYRERLNHSTPQGWIAELIVTEVARGRGIGKRLLDRAEAAARARGCWGIALESATWRSDAHRFYEREGWDDAAKAFIKELSG